MSDELVPTRSVEADFFDALNRLKSGRPTNPKLLEQLAKGRIGITYSSVAMEAGHSRTLIGTADSRYPKVRAAVGAAATRKLPVQKAKKVCDPPNSVPVSELKRRLHAADTLVATLLLELADERKRLDIADRRADRLAKANDQESPRGGNIIPFPKR